MGSECRSRGSSEPPRRHSTDRRPALRPGPVGTPACVSRRFRRGQQCGALFMVGRCRGPRTVSPGSQDSGRAIPIRRPSRGDTLAFGTPVNCDTEEPNPEQPHPRQSVVIHLSPHDLRPSSPAPKIAPSRTREASAGGQPTGIDMDRGPPPHRNRPVGRSRFPRIHRAGGARHARPSVQSGRPTSDRPPAAPYRATQSHHGVTATKAPKTLRKQMSSGVPPVGCPSASQEPLESAVPVRQPSETDGATSRPPGKVPLPDFSS